VSSGISGFGFPITVQRAEFDVDVGQMIQTLDETRIEEIAVSSIAALTGG
jgi:hypothetical protein